MPFSWGLSIERGSDSNPPFLSLSPFSLHEYPDFFSPFALTDYASWFLIDPSGVGFSMFVGFSIAAV